MRALASVAAVTYLRSGGAQGAHGAPREAPRRALGAPTKTERGAWGRSPHLNETGLRPEPPHALRGDPIAPLPAREARRARLGQCGGGHLSEVRRGAGRARRAPRGSSWGYRGPHESRAGGLGAQPPIY